jgi:hypothetical protein
MRKIYALVLICWPAVAPAQITVGSDEKPVKAAILEVKSQTADGDNVTSRTGGVVMPRLRLQNPATLEPVILNDDPDLATLKEVHTGLIVYNLTSDANFKAGLYVWDGLRWEAIISDAGEGAATIALENGLTFASSGAAAELGGTLNAHTDINQNNNAMSFADGGAWSVNATDLIVKGGNTGLGKEPSPGRKLDVSGDVLVTGGLAVKGETSLKHVAITGTGASPAHITYAPDGRRKEQRFLVSSGSAGQAYWRVVGGLSSVDQTPLPAATLRFVPSSQTAGYLDTGMGVELPPGKWLISYSVRLVSVSLTTASTGDIKPTSFRFTMLDNGVPIPATGKKAYDDCRAYPDTYYNSCTGFLILENDSNQDKTYYLGIKTQEMGLNWPAGQVELINKNNSDAYLIPLLLDY